MIEEVYIDGVVTSSDEEESQEVQQPEWYYCDVCGGEFKPTTPPLPGQKLYELHECAWGKRKAKQDAKIACKHCGVKLPAPTHCDCPADIAQAQGRRRRRRQED